jgi:hypothetical protein
MMAVMGGWIVSVEVRGALVRNDYKHIKESLDRIIQKLYPDE